MFKFILLFGISCSVYAIPSNPERNVPEPDEEEKGEMVCFDTAQALHKVITSLRGGTSAKYITTKIKENRDNHIVLIINEQNTIANKKAIIGNVNRVTELAIKMVYLANGLEQDVSAEEASAVYFDECSGALHAYYDNIKKANK